MMAIIEMIIVMINLTNANAINSYQASVLFFSLLSKAIDMFIELELNFASKLK